MTNIEKLIKAIKFINKSGFASSVEKFFVIEDNTLYSVVAYFYDYHKGDFSVTDKSLVSEEQAITHLKSPLINHTVNAILEEQEATIAKQQRIAKFYESE